MQLHDWLSQERGRVKALAEHLRIPASLVSKMAGGAKRIPLDHCPYIEAFTGGEVPCEVQRPDKVEYFRLLQQRRQVAAHGACPCDGSIPSSRACSEVL